MFGPGSADLALEVCGYSSEPQIKGRGPGRAGPRYLLSKLEGETESEMAAMVSDRWQHQGLGTEMVRRLIGVARDQHLRRIFADILPDNREMVAVCEKLGFRNERCPDDPTLLAVLDL